MTTRWHCWHTLCAVFYSSHTLLQCGKALLGMAALEWVCLERHKNPTYLCDGCMPFFPDALSSSLASHLFPSPRQHPACSECVGHHTSSSISPHSSPLRMWHGFEPVLYTAGAQVIPIYIYPDGTVSRLPLVAICLCSGRKLWYDSKAIS